MNIIGRTIANRYEIISKTGVGGMATVYIAKDTVLNRNVAVKVLKDEFTTDDEFIKRFNSEAQAAASLTHPNIVSIYDVGNEDGIYYIVMELIRGKTLKQIITEEGALPWKWSVNIAMQIASALETAHRNNIVHRDIKPHNIIITEDGVAKVTDFGIAKAVSNSTITAFGTTIGSVHYFSPEQAKGGYTDAKSDTRRMGVVTDDMVRNAEKNANKKKKKGLAKFFAEHPKAKVPVILLICIILFFGSIAVTSAALNASSPKSVQIPNLIGKTEEEAKAELEKLKLEYVKQSEDYNTEYEAGQIYEQSPKYMANYTVKEKSTITVKVSKGTEKVKVPKVAGMTYDKAVAELEANKLKTEKIEETSKEIKEGIVISQEVDANTEANAGDTIKIHVSIGTGIAQVVMPNVVGKTEKDATATLEGKNLKVNVEYNLDATSDDGIVKEQSIKSGENIDEGTEITLKVNKVKQTKEAKVIINVKSLTKYNPTNSATNTVGNAETGTTADDSKVTIILNGETRTGVDRSDTDYAIRLTGNDGEKITVSITIKSENGQKTYYSSSNYYITFGTDTEITIK